ncbi:GNAT family N-acetyltransferase [Brevibacterium sp. JSBI002]|uniref:GNAT family N-acetyltransferase n=1 Tax=Brevibacterium sp. JSBI002 TaxID=2886045 RepID=UPI0022317F39|nr:GNAT family N-acetyltransferase [Brevibacterium sp. JSBI002]UZD61709.1 GNAT family N-acetyltransferase [Brevibacterium sp. JSBI002]
MTAHPSAPLVDAHRQKLRAAGFEVTELTSADIPDYVELVSSAYRGEGSKQGWTTEADLLGGQRLDGPMAEDMLAEADSQILLARDGQGSAVASVYVRKPEDGASYLGVLAVSPLGQGKGVGSLLISLAESWVAEHWGATSMRMSVINKRDELIAYYERRGYVRTGEIEPFPYGDERFGLPKVNDLEFVLLAKPLS